jgi:hypothetical protein
MFFIAKHAPWIIVHPIFYPFGASFGQLAYVRAFGNEAPYQLVGVLVAALLPCADFYCAEALVAAMNSSNFFLAWPLSMSSAAKAMHWRMVMSFLPM